jgi:excisionase family DNA binding protein
MPRNNSKRIIRTATAMPTSTAMAPVLVTPHFMSVNQVAHSLAVSSKTVRRAIQDKRLVATRFGRRVLVSQGALQQFMTTLITAGSMAPRPRRKR